MNRLSADQLAQVRELANAGLDPSKAAEKWLSGMSADEQRELLAVVLPSFLRVTWARFRLTSTRRLTDRTFSESPKPKFGPSKAARSRDAYADWLASMLHVGKGVWKPLRDCTRADLLFAAEERGALARRNASQAEMYSSLAEVVTSTLGKARRADVERVLSGVAA